MCMMWVICSLHSHLGQYTVLTSTAQIDKGLAVQFQKEQQHKADPNSAVSRLPMYIQPRPTFCGVHGVVPIILIAAVRYQGIARQR